MDVRSTARGAGKRTVVKSNREGPLMFLCHLQRPALTGLAVLQVLMFFALLAGLAPHPPRITPFFAMGPFLSASVALCLTVLWLPRGAGRLSAVLSGLAALMALLSYGPQKWADPNIAEIWPAVLLGQVLALVLLGGAWMRMRRPADAPAGLRTGDA